MRQHTGSTLKIVLTIRKKITKVKKKSKQKNFWSFIRNLRKDSAGAAPFRIQGDTFSDPSDKAKILNEQFSTVFTQDPPGSMPDKGPSFFPSMSQIDISTPGVKKVLDNLKSHKASGPDSIPTIVLKEQSNEIAPILQIIFQIYITTGQVLDDWKKLTWLQY